MSRADIGIFVDANVVADVQSMLNFKKYFADPAIGTVGACLKYIDPISNRVNVGSLYWRLEEHIKALESASGSTPGADGSMFATRLANYPNFPDDNCDDFRVSMQSVMDGKRCISAHDICVYEKSAAHIWDEFKRKRRIACGAMAAHKDMRNGLKKMRAMDRFKYISHRLLRWNGAAFLWLFGIFILPILWENPWIVVAVLCAILCMMLFKTTQKHLITIFEIWLSIQAVQIGVLENLFGKSYKTWTPPQSRNHVENPS